MIWLKRLALPSIVCSDARLFCKNKPKIGNKTVKQAQHELAEKFNKTKNQQENQMNK